jgi:hypothetical protein
MLINFSVGGLEQCLVLPIGWLVLTYIDARMTGITSFYPFIILQSDQHIAKLINCQG